MYISFKNWKKKKKNMIFPAQIELMLVTIYEGSSNSQDCANHLENFPERLICFSIIRGTLIRSRAPHESFKDIHCLLLSQAQVKV